MGYLLILLGLVVLGVALAALIRGHLGWARIPSRKTAVLTLNVGVVVVGIGGALTPQPLMDTDANRAPATARAAPSATRQWPRFRAVSRLPRGVPTPSPLLPDWPTPPCGTPSRSASRAVTGHQHRQRLVGRRAARPGCVAELRRWGIRAAAQRCHPRAADRHRREGARRPRVHPMVGLRGQARPAVTRRCRRELA